MQIKAEKDRLAFTPSWIGRPFYMVPESATSFFNVDSGNPAIKLVKGPDGNVTSILVNDRDYWDKVPH